jgi:hypothetical protein
MQSKASMIAAQVEWVVMKKFRFICVKLLSVLMWCGEMEWLLDS